MGEDDYILLAGKKRMAVFFISKHYSSTCLEGLRWPLPQLRPESGST
jgi:hypothetical protein